MSELWVVFRNLGKLGNAQGMAPALNSLEG